MYTDLFVDRVEINALVVVIPDWSSITTVRVRLVDVPDHVIMAIRKEGQKRFRVRANLNAGSELGLNIRWQ